MMPKTLLAVGLLTLLFSFGCQSKCDALKDTCNLCVDPETKSECQNTVNGGNNDVCLSENRILSGLCR
jgi:hypothetical protein